MTRDDEKELRSIAASTTADANAITKELEKMTRSRDPLAAFVHQIKAASFREDITKGRHGWPQPR